ncbi:Ribonuclease H domain [Sesbania bispinosa]|nr:Ribonuclease H domain [Sesbania bispinosa]
MDIVVSGILSGEMRVICVMRSLWWTSMMWKFEFELWEGSWQFQCLHTNLPQGIINSIKNHDLLLSASVYDKFCQGLAQVGSIFLVAAWEIWLNRNRMYFNGLDHCISNLLPHIFAHTVSIPKMFAFEGDYHTIVYKWISWPCPVDGEIALNEDGSSLSNPGASGFGDIFRDYTGQWMHGYFENIGISEILQAELLAILNGLHIAWKLGYRKVICYSDSKTALSLIS